MQGRTYIFLFLIGISIITSQTSDSLNKSEIFSKTTHNTVYKGNFIIDFPKEAGEGELIYFRILHRENPSEYIYNFNFGDGTRRSNSDGIESHIYKGQGNINKDLGLTGMDISISMFTKDGVAVNSFEQFLPVENRPPVISIPDDFPIEGLEGSKLEFSVDASDPGEKDKLFYSWSWGDNSEDIIEKPLNSFQKHTYYDDGEYTITIVVIDDDKERDREFFDNGEAVKEEIIKIKNVAPIIDNYSIPAESNEGDTLIFDVSVIDPGPLDIITYSWDFGNGDRMKLTDEVARYAYPNDSKDSTFTISLIVDDGDGGLDSLKKQIKINNLPPKISMIPPTKVMEGDSIEFIADVYDPGRLDKFSFQWDFGDGILDTSRAPYYKFTDNGEFPIKLYAMDDAGASDSLVYIVNVNNVDPVINIVDIPQTGVEGDSIQYKIDVQDPGDDTFTYSWNFGDGATSSDLSPIHTYKDNGTYTLNIMVEDDDKGFAQQTKKIVISNIAPIVTATFPESIEEGEQININYTVTDPGDDTFTYEFDFGDGGGITDSPFHTYNDNGEYDVYVSVTDDDGGNSTLSSKLLVVNVNPVPIITYPNDILEGSEYRYTGSASDKGIDDTHTFLFDFGDGKTDTSRNSFHSYKDNGIYRMILEASDDDGGVDTLMREINVKNVPPEIAASFTSTAKVQIALGDGGSEGINTISQTIDINATEDELTNPSGDKGAKIYFIASVEDPGDDDRHQLSWDFGDKSKKIKKKFEPKVLNRPDTTEYIYTKNGIFEVTLIASDKDNGSDTLKQVITISNVTPAMAATILSPDSSFQSTLIFPLTARGGSEDKKFSWLFGDGDSSLTILPIHLYKDRTEYQIASRVIDKFGYQDIRRIKVNTRTKKPSFFDIEVPDSYVKADTVQYFKSDFYSLSGPRQRNYDPDTFPTIVFTLENKTDETKAVNFNPILPKDWSLINYSAPESIEPNETKRIRITLHIPNDVSADSQYKLRMISRIGNLDDMVSLMPITYIDINPKPNFRLESIREEQDIFIDRKEKINFFVRNTGNVTDEYSFDATVPLGWEIVSVPKNVKIKPGKQKEVSLSVRAPQSINIRGNYKIEFVATSMKLKESIGEWVDAIVGRDAYCSDKIVDEYCTKSDFSDKTSCIGGSGVWMSTYQGSANEDVCLMDREWEPEVPFKPARCSEPEWGTKEQCEQESTWVFPVEAKDAYCSDGYSITDEGCQANRKWYRTDIEAALDEPHYCILVDDSSNIIYDENDGTIIKDNRATTMEECEQGRNWFPAVEFKAGYCVDEVSEYSQCEFAGTWIEEQQYIAARCTDEVSTTEEQCISSRRWFPKIESKDAYCSDGKSISKELCEEVPNGLNKYSQIFVTPKISKKSYNKGSLIAYVPLQFGFNLGSIQKGMLPDGKVYLRTGDVKLNKRILNLEIIQGLNSEKVTASDGSDSSSFKSSLDRLYLKFGRDKFEITAGDESTPITPMFDNSQTFNILNLNNIDMMRGILLRYRIGENANIVLGTGDGITTDFRNNYFTLNNFKLDKSSQPRYSLTVQNKVYNDVADSTSSIITIERFGKIKYDGVDPSSVRDASGFLLGLSRTTGVDSSTIDLSFQYLKNRMFSIGPGVRKDSVLAIADTSQTISNNFLDRYKDIINNLNTNVNVSSKLIYFGNDFNSHQKGHAGLDFIVRWKPVENLYNFNHVQILRKSLYQTKPIYGTETWNDCGYDGVCFDDVGYDDTGEGNNSYDVGEELYDLNGDGELTDGDIITGYHANSNILNYTGRFLYSMKNNININVGIELDKEYFPNTEGAKLNETEVDIRAYQAKGIDQRFAYFKWKEKYDGLYNIYDRYIQLLLGYDNQYNFSRLRVEGGLMKSVSTDLTSFILVNSEFNIRKIKMNLYMNVLKLEELFSNNFCYNPLGQGCDNYGGVGLITKFPLSFLGFKSNISTGLVRYNSNDEWRMLLSITPQGKSSTFNIPAPFTKIKGRYKGKLFIDQNGNGLRDRFERGIPNVILYLNGDNAVTDSRGNFEFIAMDPKLNDSGKIIPYQLSYDPATLPAQYQFSNGFKKDILIVPGDNVVDEIPMTFVGKIYGIAFLDNNNNNIFDSEMEKPLPNVRLILESMENIEKETFSDVNGFYQFSDLKPGSYVVSTDSDWLPDRTESTGQENSETHFNYYGWVSDINYKKMNVELNVPIMPTELEIRWNITPE